MDRERVFLRAVSRGEFEIDSAGRIWRIAKRHGRGVLLGGGYGRGTRTSPCKRVRGEYPTKEGYLLVAITVDGTRTVTGAHRIVWASKNGRIPAGLTINHKNGKKADNRHHNLELATHSEQRIHALTVLKVRVNRPIGSKHPKTKLLEKDVLRMRALRAKGEMVKDIAARYEVKKRAVSAILRRRTWTHI